MSSTFGNTTLCVKRGGASGLAEAVSVDTVIDVSTLSANQVVLHIDKFGFSANNVTYGMLGEHEHFRYFDFFPAPKTSNTSPNIHAVIPVWGYGTVVASTHPTASVGRRIYGYLPMSSYVVMQLDKQKSKYTVDVSLDGMPEDRRPYRQLTFCDTDALYRATREDEMIIYQPLFWTSYWMEDHLNETNYKNLRTVLISSASSKTAFIVAYRIQKRVEASKGKLNLKIVGLTSRSNLTFTRKLGFYNQVFAYDEVKNIPMVSRMKDCLYIDVSGSQALNASISDSIKLELTISLGMTSVEGGNTNSIGGAKDNKEGRESFFMPEWLAVRLKQLGAKQLKEMQKAAWDQLMDDCSLWLNIETYRGRQDVLAAYKKTLKGGVPPDRGQMFSLSEKEAIGPTAKL